MDNENEKQVPRRSDRIKRNQDRQKSDKIKSREENSPAQRQEDLEIEGESAQQSQVQEKSFLSRFLSFGTRKPPSNPSTSSSFARRRVQAKAEHKKKRHILQKEILQIEEAIDLEQCEIDSMEEELPRMMAKLDPTHPLHDAEKFIQNQQDLSKYSDTLAEKKNKIKSAKIRAKSRLEAIKMEIESLESEVELEMAEISEEEDQHLGSDEEVCDPELDELATKFQDWRDKSCANPIPPTKDKVEVQSASTSAIDSIVQSLQVQNQALLGLMSQPTKNTTEKMLVRQSVGRDLPFFEGRPEEWPTFIATFRRTTESCGFTDPENVERIRKCLRGEAKRSVECLLVSPDSLPKVLNILEKKFGQADIIMEAMVKKARDVDNVKDDKPQTMIEFGTAVVNLVATIKNLGKLDHLKNPALLQELVKKLPIPVRKNWEKIVVSSPIEQGLEDFADWVETEVEVACRMCSSYKTESKQEDKKGRFKPVKNKYEEDENKFTAAGLMSGQAKKQCLFCSRTNHESKDCFTSEKMSWDEKSQLLRKSRACFKCFIVGHRKDACKTKVTCGVCSGPHHKPMCPELQINKREVGILPSAPPEVIVNAVNANFTCQQDVLLKTILVRVKGPRGSRVVRLIYDEGSQQSNITTKTVTDIGGKQVREEMSRNILFGGEMTEMRKVKIFNIEIQSLDGRYANKFELRETPVICQGIPRVPNGPWMNELRKKKMILTDWELSHVDDPEVQILIGSDLWGKLVISKPTIISGSLVAVNTVFGWTLSGQVPGVRRQDKSAAMTCVKLFLGQSNVTDLWDLDTIGIRDPSDTQTKEEKEAFAKQQFAQTVTRNDDGRYSITLPWVGGKPDIPDNKNIAMKRLSSQTEKLSQEKFLTYDNIFKNWIEEGFIEEVKQEEMNEASHYLPHRPVFKPDSQTTPVRPVFDASCKVGRAPSLNDCLEKGPNLMELIPNILLQFREKKIGIVSDIRKAFQMIEITPRDRNFLRFLWWENQDLAKLKEYRHKRVVFGINCSPYILAAVLEKHLTSVQGDLQPIARKLLKSLYVDNCVTSVNTKHEYEEFKKMTIRMMSEAKMDLCQWEHSSLWQDGGESSSQNQTGVLGLSWNKEEDCLSVKLKTVPWPEKVTKREILSTVQKIFDPIGFTCPASLQPKVLLQEIWSSKIGWDVELPREIVKKYQKWHDEVSCLSEIKIPRWINLGEDVISKELHVFCDASQIAYAAVVFLRVETKDSIRIHLLQAKARVAPLNKTTIPRLELLGCTIAARLKDSVAKALSMEEVPTVFWTDSTTALSWIKGNDDWGTFVGNRVRGIIKLSNPEQWRHVPGKVNPADLPSRGCDSRELLRSKWWEGPDWLKEAEESWPSQEFEIDEEEVMTEKKKGASLKMSVVIDAVPYSTRFSSFNKNIRVIAWCKRFLKNSSSKYKTSGELTVQEIEEAENIMWRMVQTDAFPKGENSIEKIQVIKGGDGLLYANTRLLNSDEPEQFKRPIILPTSHPVVEQLIRQAHLENGHAGAQFLMSHLRQKYWILQGRRSIKKVIHRCVRCRRHQAKKPIVPQGGLPANRVKISKVFEVTGVDLAGPLYLRDKSKVWICLFTCAVYRCIHLEVVTAISTEAFLLAFERFVARRGRPTTIYSDNGTNFTGALNLFKDMDWKRIQRESTAKRINWILNPPSAAWWGGWWERLVQSVKGLLKRMLGNSRLNYSQLESCLCSVEAVVNGRPLTFVTEDPTDLIPLTPAMFLQDIQETSYPEGELSEGDMMRMKNRGMRVLRRELQDRFKKEYLSQLIQRGKTTKNPQEFKTDDLVLVGSDNKKRLNWPMGRIVELLPGKDGKVRVARIRTQNGVFLRPLQRLYHLEVNGSENDYPMRPDVKRCKVGRGIWEKQEPVKRSSRGRELKKPDRLCIN